MLMAPWFGLALAVVLAALWLLSRRDDERDDVALNVLDRRLAQGDLSVEEHAQRRHAVRAGGHSSRSRSARWVGPVAVIAAATLIVILLNGVGMMNWGNSGWMGSHMGWGGSSSSTADVINDAPKVTVEAGELWFKPATIFVTVDAPVNLQLVNTGDMFHDLTIPTANVVLTAEPGEQAISAVEFSEPGSYEFFCSVPGHTQAGMRGTIVVAEAS